MISVRLLCRVFMIEFPYFVKTLSGDRFMQAVIDITAAAPGNLS
jgi:hypothetical protein